MKLLLKIFALTLVVVALALISGEVIARVIAPEVNLDAHTRRRPIADGALQKPAGAVRVLFAGADRDRSDALKQKLEKENPKLKWDVLGLAGGSAMNAFTLVAADRETLDLDVVALDTTAADHSWLARRGPFAGEVIVKDGALLPRMKRAPLDGALSFSQLYSALRLHLAGAHERPRQNPTDVAPLISTLRALNIVCASEEIDLYGVAPNEPSGPLGPMNKALHDELRTLSDDDALAARIAARVKERLNTIAVNRRFDALVVGDDLEGDAAHLARLDRAAVMMKDNVIELAGFDLKGAHLAEVARKVREDKEPILRALRETVQRPVELTDLLYFVDDVVQAQKGVLDGRQVHLTAARLRNSGVTVHPNQIFKKRPSREYPWRFPILPIDEPKPPEGLTAPKDGAPLGPGWAVRYENPAKESDRLAALKKKNKKLHKSVVALTEQLKAQGAEVFIDSTVRAPERGYLMWGAFVLKTATEKNLDQKIALLQKRNKEWKRNVDIAWRHPDGVQATIDAATAMADTYGVVFATQGGAKSSSHYDGKAVDFTAVNLPRKLTLRPPKGKAKTFDLSAPSQTRDLSLTPEVIEWVEKNFNMSKLRADYPHWNG